MTTELLYMTAPYCGPCKAFLPVVKELAAKHNVTLRIVDVTQDQDTPALYSVMSVPAMVLLKGGKVAGGFNSVVPRAKLEALFEATK